MCSPGASSRAMPRAFTRCVFRVLMAVRRAKGERPARQPHRVHYVQPLPGDSPGALLVGSYSNYPRRREHRARRGRPAMTSAGVPTPTRYPACHCHKPDSQPASCSSFTDFIPATSKFGFTTHVQDFISGRLPAQCPASLCCC